MECSTGENILGVGDTANIKINKLTMYLLAISNVLKHPNSCCNWHLLHVPVAASSNVKDVVRVLDVLWTPVWEWTEKAEGAGICSVLIPTFF